MPNTTLYTITDKATGHQAAGTFTIAQICAALDGVAAITVLRSIKRKGEYLAKDDTGAVVIVRPV